MTVRKLSACAALFAAAIFTAFSAQAQTQMPPPTGEQRVSFDSIPAPVQGSLTNYASGATSGAAASVWERVKNGEVVYQGRIVDVDGSARMIDVDPAGRVQSLHQFAPPLGRLIDAGRTVAWNTLPSAAQRTIAGNANGLPVTSVVQKKAANGMQIYVATTTDAMGLPIFVETTTNGNLIGVKRRSD